MTSISKGGNLPIEVPTVRAVLSWTTGPGLPDADASALLVGESGMVGSDADFVFYNQPQHPSGCVAHLGKQPHTDGRGVADAVHVDLADLPAAVDRVVLAASTGGGIFGQLPDLRLDIVDAQGNSPIAQFVLGAGDETALVTGELYRRNGQWKFRAVGQGYASGLAGLARDFGISVDDEPAPSEPVEPAAPTPQPSGPPPLPVQDDQQPVAPPPLPSQQPTAPPPLPPEQPVAPPPLPPQQPVAPPPLPPQQPVAPPPLPPQQPVAPPPPPPPSMPPPPPSEQPAQPAPTAEHPDEPEPPPLPPYDGPRPVIGQAYEPAPDGFAPPPPGR